MPTATLSSKSQLVLPASVRRKLGIRPGDRLVVDVEGDRVVIHKAATSDLEQLARFRSDLWKGFDAELDGARDDWDWPA